MTKLNFYVLLIVLSIMWHHIDHMGQLMKCYLELTRSLSGHFELPNKSNCLKWQGKGPLMYDLWMYKLVLNQMLFLLQDQLVVVVCLKIKHKLKHKKQIKNRLEIPLLDCCCVLFKFHNLIVSSSEHVTSKGSVAWNRKQRTPSKWDLK